MVLARVLHDWPDDDAVRILTRARQAIPVKAAALYVVEMVPGWRHRPGGPARPEYAGGGRRGRAQPEERFRQLLSRTGFELLEVIPTPSVSSIILALAV